MVSCKGFYTERSFFHRLLRAHYIQQYNRDTRAMNTTSPRPLICVSANARPPEDRRRLPMYATAERYVQALLKMVDCIPVLMPPVGGAVDAAEPVSRMDGLVLAGGTRPGSSPAWRSSGGGAPGRTSSRITTTGRRFPMTSPSIRAATRSSC